MRRHIYFEREKDTGTLIKRVRLIPPKRKRAGYNCLEMQRRIDARKRDRAA